MSSRFRGFTLVEILVVVSLTAILVAIAIPKFSNSNQRSREVALRAMLKQIRDAADRAEADTGVTVRVTDLVRATAPSSGWRRSRMNTDWTTVSIDARTWRGPYLSEVPVNPIIRNNTYVGGASSSTTAAWTHYSRQNFNPHYIYFPSTQRGSDGTEYRTW